MTEKVKPKRQTTKKTIEKKPRVKKAAVSSVKKETTRLRKEQKKPKTPVAETVVRVPVMAPSAVKTVVIPKEKVVEIAEEKRKPGFLQAIGRRKESVARVKIFKNGKGAATINGKDIKEYFGSNLLVDLALGALNNVSQLNKIDISAKVNGGGKKSQAESIRLGTARALLQLNPIFKKNLRKAGFLTRDPRMKERKKFGLKKARRAPQWAKR